MSTLDTAMPPRLFELADFGLRIEPTIAMRNGTQQIFQCAGCGLVAVQSSLTSGPLGACPACGRDQWWTERLPLAGLVEIEPKP